MTTQASIKMIVGLANPGSQYAATRHNAGAWFVEHLANQYHIKLKTQTKYHASIGKGSIEGHNCILVIPTTYMNLSGQAVAALTSYYKIMPTNALIVHDELDLAPGSARLKLSGGHGGHNGLRDISQSLSCNNYLRLRIGIGHPGKGLDVSSYVLSAPRLNEKLEIDRAIITSCERIPELLAGNINAAMKILHTESSHNQ